MKNVIVQYYLNYNNVGKQKNHYPTEGMPDWVKISSECMKKYADKVGADYFFFTDRQINSTSNYFEVTRFYKDKMFDEYDKLLYCDVDVLPKNMESNIFEEVDLVDIAGWCEVRMPQICVPINWSPSQGLHNRFAYFGSKLVESKRNQGQIRMLNSGVLLWSKRARIKARENFIDHEKWFHYNNALLDSSLPPTVGHSSHCLDQPYLNAMFTAHGFDVNEIDMKWNRFPCHDENYPCTFAHYVQDYRFNIPEIAKGIL